MIQKIDSLEIYLEQINLQSEVLESVLSGDELSMDISNNELAETQISIAEENQPSEIDFERPPKPKQYYSFFIPVKGVITDSFNIQRSHLGIDIAAKAKEVIKAIQNGTVIYSGWTSKGGHTIIIQHSNNFISVYKHNAVLLKKTGTFVSAGDAVALVGNTGEFSSGPHLHFELWKNGLAVNPLSYLNF
jgi:murein DD-endopeptidase MepM/ murein hydrolase activator NlpD